MTASPSTTVRPDLTVDPDLIEGIGRLGRAAEYLSGRDLEKATSLLQFAGERGFWTEKQYGLVGCLLRTAREEFTARRRNAAVDAIAERTVESYRRVRPQAAAPYREASQPAYAPRFAAALEELAQPDPLTLETPVEDEVAAALAILRRR